MPMDKYKYDRHMREISSRMIDSMDDDEPPYNVCMACAAIIAFTLDVAFRKNPEKRERMFEEVVNFIRTLMKDRNDA